MTLNAIAAKNAPVVIPVTFAGLANSETFIEIAAVVAGLAFGGMWRAANLRNEGKDWKAVRGDMAISLMVGGANAVLALALVQWLEVGRVMAMTIGVMVGATGLRAVPEARDILVSALRRKLIGDDVIYMPPPSVPDAIQDAMKKLDQID